MLSRDDLHAPKPLADLIRREVGRMSIDVAASMRVRIRALSQASFVDPRARLIHAQSLFVGGHCQLYPGATIRANGSRTPSVILGTFTIVRENAYLDAHGGWIECESGVFIGQNAVVYGQGGVRIGRNSMLAPGVTVISASHRFERTDVALKFQEESFEGINIGENCWLAANVTVLDGVTIGSGTVVGAGAVVTKNLPPMVVATGVPAKVTRIRPG